MFEKSPYSSMPPNTQTRETSSEVIPCAALPGGISPLTGGALQSEVSIVYKNVDNIQIVIQHM